MRPVSFPTTINLDFDWLYPDPPRINYELVRIEEYLERTQVLAEVAQEVAQVDMAERFEREVDPDGNPWKELAQPAFDQVGILRLSTDMYQAAISDSAWSATPVGVFFDSGSLPQGKDGGQYWQYHEQPEGRGGQRIPQRRFIGLSPDAEQNVENRADEWLAQGIMLGSRGFVPQVRSPLGRFARL